jgi:predicted nucleotidyltransferase
MSEELELLKILARRLDGAKIPYLVSGSVAASYYTEPRMTRDIDLVVELTAADVDRFVGLFRDDFYVDREMVGKEVARRGMFNLIHNEYVIKVDFIVRAESISDGDAFSRRRRVVIDGVPVWFISAEDLILAKLMWARQSHSETQMRDVSNLLRTVKPLDARYVDARVSALGLDEIYARAKA